MIFDKAITNVDNSLFFFLKCSKVSREYSSVVECFPIVLEALGSVPITAKNQNAPKCSFFRT